MFKSLVCSFLALMAIPTFTMQRPRTLAMDQDTLNQGLIRAVKNNNLEDARNLLRLGAQATAREKTITKDYTKQNEALTQSRSTHSCEIHGEHAMGIHHRNCDGQCAYRRQHNSLLWPPLRSTQYHSSGLFDYDGPSYRTTSSYSLDRLRQQTEFILPEPEEIITWGSSALILAYNKGNPEMCRLLLNNGAKRDDLFNKDLLHDAAKKNNGPMCRLLLENGAAVDRRDTLRNTPLHYAAQAGNNLACTALLKHGADIHLPTDRATHANHIGHTPLHLAATKGHRSTCKLLLNKNHITFLGCIRKLAVEGSLGAKTLYRERNSLLKPLLEHQSYAGILEDLQKQEQEARERAERERIRYRQEEEARLHQLERQRQEDIARAQRRDAERAQAWRIAQEQQAAQIEAVRAEQAAHAAVPAPGIEVARTAQAAIPAQEYEQPIPPIHEPEESFLEKPVVRGALAIGGIALVSVAIYKLYKWMQRKTIKEKPKKEAGRKKQASGATLENARKLLYNS